MAVRSFQAPFGTWRGTDMTPHKVLGRPPALLQSVNRSRLLRAVRSTAIIVEVIADRGGYLDVQTVDWDAYWRPFAGELPAAWRRQLRVLQEAREAYVASGFDLARAGQYCSCYFKLAVDRLT